MATTKAMTTATDEITADDRAAIAHITEVVAAAPDEQEFPRCECGCGAIRNPKRHFVVGRDAKHKSNLLRLWDAGQGAMAEELVTRGWYTWEQLQDRGAKLSAKVEKVAKAVTEAKPEVEAL